MKSSTLIVSYLWKDTWSRWLEQPSSLFARLLVGLLLAAVATGILVVFSLMERNLRSRLDQFGLNTLVVREMVSADPQLLWTVGSAHRLQALEAGGQRVALRQLFMRADAELRKDLVVLAYPPEALRFLAPWLEPDMPLTLVSDFLPEDIRVRVNLQRSSGFATVKRMPDFFRPLGFDSFLLVPQGWTLEGERMGFSDTTLFQRAANAPSMKRYVEAVNLLYSLDQRNPPQIQSALPLINELENLQSRQKQWRLLVAGAMGLVVALVYGAIAILEFRQNLFISALLRSLGTPSFLLYVRQWIESAILVNLAAVAAVGLIAGFHQEIFGTLGFSQTVLDLSQGNPYFSSEIALILVCMNLGAFLSSLPVAIGLRQPVGAVLN